MEGICVVEEDKGDDGDDQDEEGVNEEEVEEVLADDEDGVDDDRHFLIGVAEDGEDLDDGYSPEVVVDDEVAVGDECSHYHKDYPETYHIAPRFPQESTDPLGNTPHQHLHQIAPETDVLNSVQELQFRGCIVSLLKHNDHRLHEDRPVYVVVEVRGTVQHLNHRYDAML